MTVTDNDVLEHFRMQTRCEFCGRTGYMMLPHHTFQRRGMGGGSQLDIRINLCALCGYCHDGTHYSGKPSTKELKELIARREGRTAEDIQAEIWAILRGE